MRMVVVVVLAVRAECDVAMSNNEGMFDVR